MTASRVHTAAEPCICGHPYSAHPTPSTGGRGFGGRRVCDECDCNRYQSRWISRRKTCDCDGLSLDSHPSCVRCSILVGPGHLEKAVNERGLCQGCSDYAARRPVARWDVHYQVEEAMFG